MFTQDETAKLAREYAEEIYPNLSDKIISLRTQEIKNAERLIRFLLRTHCIVSKEKVRGMMSELDNDLKAADRLKMDFTPAAQLQKGRIQGHPIGAKSAILALFDAETFKNSEL